MASRSGRLSKTESRVSGSRESRRLGSDIRVSTRRGSMAPSAVDYFDADGDLDYERVVRNYNCGAGWEREILFFPEDDVETENVDRFHRTVLSSIPRTVKDAPVDAYVAKCFEFYESNSLLVNRSYSDFGKYFSSDSFKEELAEHRFEIDMIKEVGDKKSGLDSLFPESLDSSAESDLVPELMDKQSSTTDMRSQDRQKLFRVFAMNDDQGGGFENVHHSSSVPFSERFGKRLIVEVKDLRLQLADLEPLFCTLACFDLSQKKRLSEDFNFDLNSKDMLEMMSDFLDKPDKITKSRKSIFSFHHIHPEIYLVLTVYKVFQGDDSCLDPYSKDVVKSRDKLDKAVRGYCAKLGRYRQPFCWAAKQLFADNCGLKEEGTQFIGPLYRMSCFKGGCFNEDELLKCLNDMKMDKVRKKMQQVLGTLSLSIQDVNLVESADDGARILAGRVTPAFFDVKDAEGNPCPAEYPHKIIKELESFPQTPLMIPATTYCNHFYVGPIEVNFSNGWPFGKVPCKNICVSVEVRTDETSESPIPIIYGEQIGKQFVDRVYSSTSKANKVPQFFREFKILLPPVLTSNHHILFSFWNVNSAIVEKKKKTGEGAETMIAYSVLPLTMGDPPRLVNDVTSLPVVALPAGELPLNYFSCFKNDAQVKFVDNKKPVFRLVTRAMSTIFTSDEPLNLFFKSVDDEDSDKIAEGLVGLREASTVELVRFFPVIMNIMLDLLCKRPQGGLGATCTMTMSRILTKINGEEPGARNGLFNPYIHYVFQNVKETFEDRETWHLIVSSWLEMLKNSNIPREDMSDALKWAWLLFDIIIKSLTLDLFARDKLQADRCDRCDMEVMKGALNDLLDEVVKHVTDTSKSSHLAAKNLNRNTALFLRDLFALIDRGLVFKLVKKYMMDVHAPSEKESLNENLTEFRFEFLKIVANYEHYVPLNFPTRMVVTDADTVIEKMRKRHVLSGMIQDKVVEVLFDSSVVDSLRLKALITFRDLLTKHDFDSRYQSQESEERIASLYLPFVLMLVEKQRNESWFGSMQDILEQFNRDAGNKVKLGSEFFDSLSQQDLEVRRNCLVCFLFVLKNAVKTVQSWWRKASKDQLLAFIELLIFAVKYFEYAGKSAIQDRMQRSQQKEKAAEAKNMLESMYSGGMSAARRTARREHNATFSTQGGSRSSASTSNPAEVDRRTFHKNRTLHTHTLAHKPVLFDVSSEANLSSEVALVVLDIYAELVRDFQERRETSGRGQEDHRRESTRLMCCRESQKQNKGAVFDALFHLLSFFLVSSQSERVVACLWPVLKQFTSTFAYKIFISSNTEYCKRLCHQTTQHMNFQSVQTRREASTFLYLLLRKNFEQTRQAGVNTVPPTPANFSRAKVQITTGISALVTEGSDIGEESVAVNESWMKRGLAAIAAYGKRKETFLKGTLRSDFARQLEDLTARLTSILSDSILLSDHKHDPEMTCDLYYRIAQSYKHAPDLRLLFLSKLAERQRKEKNFCEAALCKIHIAGMIAEYLNVLGATPPGLPESCESFVKVTGSVLGEKAPTEISSDVRGFCDVARFTDTEFISVLCEKDHGENGGGAIDLLKKAEHFELISLVYDLLIPYYQNQRNFARLSEVHRDLGDVYFEILKANKMDHRYLGSFFRVGFYGENWGELDGKEYIYKENKITHLFELSERLKNQYKEKHGEIKIFPDSNVVHRSVLEAGVCYLQITKVEPFLDAADEATRLTPYEREVNLSQFVFETPFTLSGSAHGAIDEQCKRQTILTISSPYVFPYILKRIQIKRRAEKELQPVQVAIEAMGNQSARLRTMAQARMPDHRALQAILQGSVRLQVNEGPMGYCSAFLGSERNTQYSIPDEDIEEFRDVMAGFLRAARKALLKNLVLVERAITARTVQESTSMRLFHEELHRGFVEMTDKMLPFISRDATEEEDLKDDLMAGLEEKEEEGFDEMEGDSAESTPSSAVTTPK